MRLAIYLADAVGNPNGLTDMQGRESMKTERVSNTTVIAFEMGVGLSTTMPRLPLNSAPAQTRLLPRTERQFLLDAFAKLCRKRGRRNMNSSFPRKE